MVLFCNDGSEPLQMKIKDQWLTYMLVLFVSSLCCIFVVILINVWLDRIERFEVRLLISIIIAALDI